MREFAAARGIQDAERRIALAQGSPGFAMSLDLEVYDRRRAAMLTLLEVAAGVTPFAAWVRYAESGASRQEKLEPLLRSLYGLLEDVLRLQQGGENICNADVRPSLRRWLARERSAGFARRSPRRMSCRNWYAATFRRILRSIR